MEEGFLVFVNQGLKGPGNHRAPCRAMIGDLNGTGCLSPSACDPFSIRVMNGLKSNRYGSATRVLIVGSLLLAPTGGAFAQRGSLSGKISDAATGAPIPHAPVRAYLHGRSVAAGASSEGDGGYTIDNLPPGRYAVCVPAGETYRPVVVPAVEVRADNTARVDLRARQSLVIDGDSWVQAYPSFAQSFAATGLGLTVAQIKAFGSQRRVTLQVLDGEGPTERPLGPPRTTEPVGGEGTASVCWAGGEVTTIPGRVYTLKMSAAEGQMWVPGVAGRGDVYPLGMAWFDGSARPHSDLGLLLCEDSDDLRTDYALAGSRRDHRAISAGQTFVALSRCITFASAQLAGVGAAPSHVRFSIHEGGPGGPQLGPSKAVAPGPDAAVVWGPQEVPVEPGGVYYLHIESYSGGEFLINYQRDAYAQGQAFFDGRADPTRDLSAFVGGEISDEDFARLHAHPQRLEPVVLVNPSFEEGADGWQREGQTGAVVGCDEGIVPAWGSAMFGWTSLDKGEGSRTTIYQQVEATPGRTYCFSGSVFTDHRGGRSSDVKVRLIVLPAGGTAVRDLAHLTSSQWYATEGQWRRGSVEFKAAAASITVGFELEQRWSLPASQLYVDGAQLERIGDR
ncbi:MAG: carboxypeptidase regulatory-like domain-containing protein [Planctomycetes bacterium]|nr:carboxypeptidase regulatory-like domain-containing protein [Planctomycetota bacterium]